MYFVQLADLCYSYTMPYRVGRNPTLTTNFFCFASGTLTRVWLDLVWALFYNTWCLYTLKQWLNWKHRQKNSKTFWYRKYILLLRERERERQTLEIKKNPSNKASTLRFRSNYSDNYINIAEFNSGTCCPSSRSYFPFSPQLLNPLKCTILLFPTGNLFQTGHLAFPKHEFVYAKMTF